MKKFIAIVLCMILLTIPVLAATSITAPKATINLDGVKDDAYAGPFDVKSFRADPGATAKVWAAWDDNYIYYYIEVADATPFHEHGNMYERDCVEMFFDWYNAKDEDTGDEDHPYWQLRICSAPNEDGKQFSLNINYAALGWDDHEEEYNILGNSVVKLSATNYIVEVRVPYKQAGIKVGEGSVIGIDFQIGDNQTGDGRASQAYINDDFVSDSQWTNPAELGGLLTLGAAPAAPVVEEVVVAAPEAPAPVVEEASPAPAPAPAPAPVVTAPKIGDAGIIALSVVMIIAAAGVVIFRRKTAK